MSVSTGINGVVGSKGQHKGTQGASGGTQGGVGNAPAGSGSGLRIDLEPLYEGIKAGLTLDQWVAYKRALSQFIQGKISRQELGMVMDPIIQGPKARLHNQLLLALFYNTFRDLPPMEVATFVSASNKPSLGTANGPGAGGKGSVDAQEARLKVEVMGLANRDRRRVKEITQQDDPFDLLPSMLHEYHVSKQIRFPEITNPTQSINRASIESDIKSRYSLPLACESGEFPELENIRLRMLPICYEEGVFGGASSDTAAFMNIAAEVFVKEVLSNVIQRVRSNAPGYIKTDMFKRMESMGLTGERAQARLGEIDWGRKRKRRRNNNDEPLLPDLKSLYPHTTGISVETGERKQLGMSDLRLSLSMGDNYLCQLPHSAYKIMSSGRDTLEEENKPQFQESHHSFSQSSHESMHTSPSKKRKFAQSSISARDMARDMARSVSSSLIGRSNSFSATNGVRVSFSSRGTHTFNLPASKPSIQTIVPLSLYNTPDSELARKWHGEYEEEIGFLDDVDYGGWEGGGREDRNALRGLLDECLAN